MHNTDLVERVVTPTVRVSTQAAPQRILNSIMRAHGGLRDDTTVVVIDIMPPDKSFTELGASGFASSGCLCLCAPLLPHRAPAQ